MFKKLKLKIKLAKIAWVIVAILFIAMIISNIHLNSKMIQLENEIELLK